MIEPAFDAFAPAYTAGRASLLVAKLIADQRQAAKRFA